MAHIGSARSRPLLIGLTTVAIAGIGLAMPSGATPAPSATDVTLTSGTTLQSTWDLRNTVATNNGLPTGGSCASTAGMGVNDATYDPTGADMTDAFDEALLFFVNNHQVVAPTNWDVQTDPANAALNRVVTAGPVSVGGVNATVEYRAMATQQVLRSTVYLANPGTSAVTVPFTLATNNGSDSSTLTVASSSGDTTLTDADRWLVTSDSLTTPGDPVNTHVLAGPGALAAPPTGTSATVFSCSGTEGVLTTYNVTIPAGATRGLMFFNELSATTAAATSSAARFSQYLAATDELLTGLSEGQRASIVNWQLTARQPDGLIRKVDSHFIGNNIYNTTARRQTVRSRAHRTEIRTFYVRVYNDGDGQATFAVHGYKSANGVRVRYFSGGVNVTAAMTSPSGMLITRGAGEYQKIKVRVKIGAHAAIGSRKYAKVVATWTVGSTSLTDAVKGVVRVR